MDYEEEIILKATVEINALDSVYRAIYTSGHTLMMFNTLENDLIEFLKYIPLEYYKESNERELIYSPKLANILMNIGSQIDSFFRYWQKVHDKCKIGIKDLSFENYKMIEQSDFSLNKEIYILSIDKRIKPFEIVETDNKAVSWKKWNGNTNCWWSAYNHVKHNGYYAKKEGNLDYVINSLGALFILNCIHEDLKPLLEKYGYRDDRSHDPFRGWRSQLFYFKT